MRRRRSSFLPSTSGVSLVFTLPTGPSAAHTFMAAMLAVLDAGFGFGREWPGQLASSYDPHGEAYAPPICVPAGSFAAPADALDCIGQVAHHFNRSIALSFVHAHQVVAVTGRLYDEPNMLSVSLDWAPAAWQQLVAHASARAVSVTLLQIGRTLFALLPVRYVVIGPTALLADLAGQPDVVHRADVPVLLCRQAAVRVPGSRWTAVYVEPLPGGLLVVRQWNVSQPATLRVRPMFGRRRRTAGQPKWKREAGTLQRL